MSSEGVLPGFHYVLISFSLGHHTPSAGGPFSALTPSIWPQDILAKYTQVGCGAGRGCSLAPHRSKGTLVISGGLWKRQGEKEGGVHFSSSGLVVDTCLLLCVFCGCILALARGSCRAQRNLCELLPCCCATIAPLWKCWHPRGVSVTTRLLRLTCAWQEMLPSGLVTRWAEQEGRKQPWNFVTLSAMFCWRQLSPLK